MTAFTPNSGSTVNWDTLSGGSTNATLDTYTISNNTTLLIDTDSYQCANHSSAFGSLDTVSFSGTGGKLKIDGTNVRVIPFNTGSSTVPAIGTTISQAGSGTCVDCGHAYLAKRGVAESNTDFDSGPTTSLFACRVTNWVSNSASGYLNICAVNIENGSTGVQSGYVQIYYSVTTDEIRCYVGEGFTTQDFLIRSGAPTQWFRIAIACGGGLTDPVTLHYIFEDQGSVTSVVVSDVGGDTNKGGRLRQFIIGGANFGSDEESYNLRVAQVGIFKRNFTAADLLTQRSSSTPSFTGAQLMAWYDWSNWSGDPWNDVGATYGAAGTFDLQEFDALEGSTVADVPGSWGGSGASATLLGVWSSWLTEPLAAAAAMPATGFIKVKNKTGNFTAGALTGISASATGADVTGWIEVRGADTAQITVPRVGEFEVTGDWFELGTTNGSRGQVLACPTTATVAGVFPGVQIETAAGSGTYVWYASVGSLAAASTTPTTELEGRFIWQTTSGIRIGSDGTNNVGYLPPTGCKVRIPNVILTCCTRAAGPGSGPRVLPNSTLATRQEYVTTNAGKITISKCVHQWYALWSQPFSVTLTDSAFNDTINISEQSAAMAINGCVVAPTQVQINNAMTLASCFGGGSVSNNFFVRISLAASGNYAVACSFITGVTFSGNRTEALAARGNATTGAWTITQAVNCSWATDVTIGGRHLHVSSVNPIYTDFTYVDTFNAATTSTNPMSGLDFTAGTTGAKVTGFLLPGTNKQPYNALVSFTASYNGVVKVIGTRASPLNLGSANQAGLIVTSGGNNDNIKVQRCYCSNTRTGLWGFVNSDNNVTLESVAGDYADTTALAALNSVQKGCGVTSATTGQVSVYGTHWKDEFTAAATGRIIALLNEPTSLTAAQCSITAGTPKFNSAGQILMTTLNDQVVLEMPYFALGHSSAANIAPTFTGTNTGNHTFEFQFDKGSGYSAWATLNQTNWNAVGAITAGTGIKLKLRITCSVASATNAITCVRVDTVSSTSLQTTDVYPLETVTITLTGLKNPTEVRVFSAGTTTQITGTGAETVTSGTHAFSVAPSEAVDISILSLGYQNMRILNYSTASNASIPVSQVLDRQYLNA